LIYYKKEKKGRGKSMGDTSFIPRKYIYLTGIKNIFIENLFWLTELDKHLYNSNSLDCAFEKS
jgi:hypothetical protein